MHERGGSPGPDPVARGLPGPGTARLGVRGLRRTPDVERGNHPGDRPAAPPARAGDDPLGGRLDAQDAAARHAGPSPLARQPGRRDPGHLPRRLAARLRRPRLVKRRNKNFCRRARLSIISASTERITGHRDWGLMDQAAAAPTLKWYQGIERYCWVVLTVAALGWLFDTMDQNLYNLIRQASLEDLLKPHDGALTLQEKNDLSARAKEIGGTINATFLIGWAIGGFIFGILGDRIGRTKTMISTILIYAVFTGLSGLAHTWQVYALARFLTGLGVGGEWAAGASLVAETFPPRSRPMALGFLQALSAIGNMLAAVVTMGIGGDLRWRWVYFVGIVPAFLVVWIQTGIKEPEKWLQAKERASL